MADRHDSGSCVGNDVRVQVPYSALNNIEIKAGKLPAFCFVNKIKERCFVYGE